MIMACPVDQTELRVTERTGIELDWCPTCRGVWLDRGELDKILERSALPSGRATQDRGRRELDDDHDDHDDRDDDRRPRGKRRRGGFLDDLFDLR